MKNVIQAILPKQLLFIAIIAIFGIFCINISKHNFLINLDSYEFLYIANYYKRIDSPQFNFFNRIGYGTFIGNVSKPFCKKIETKDIIYTNPECIVEVSRNINAVLVILTSIILYISVFLLKRSYFAGFISAIIFVSNPWILFLSSSVLNDLFGIFLLSLVILITICIDKFKELNASTSRVYDTKILSGLVVILLTVIPLIRIEYILVLIPLLFLKRIRKLNALLSVLGAIILNLIFILPYQIDSLSLNNYNWLLSQYYIISPLIQYWYYWGSVALIAGVTYPFWKKINTKYILCAILSLCFFVISKEEGLTFLSSFIQSNFIAILIIVLSLIFLPRNSDETNQITIYTNLFWLTTLVFFVFYRTLYFHHLTVLILPISLICGIYLSTNGDNIWLGTNRNYRYATAVLFTIVLVTYNLNTSTIKLNAINQNAHTKDLAQITVEEIKKDLTSLNLKKTDPKLILTNFDLALKALYPYYRAEETKIQYIEGDIGKENESQFREIIIYSFDKDKTAKDLEGKYELISEKEIELNPNIIEYDSRVKERNTTKIYRKLYEATN